MNKLLVILLLCYPIHAYTQGLSLEYSIGYGTYDLNDIKSLENSMLDSYGLKDVDRFPNYRTHSVALGFVRGRHHFGGNYSYLTTGGRLNRADYSGYYTVDMIINGYRLGAFYRNYIDTRFSRLSIYLQLSSGVLISNLKMNEQVNVYSESAQETTTLKGVGGYFEPTIGASFRFTNWLHLSLGGGYESDFWDTMKLSGKKTQINADWTGFRLYGGLLFILPAKK